MWCRNCQQDVPAVARGAKGPLVCPRCEHDLPAAVRAGGVSVGEEVSDTGIALDSYGSSSSDRSPLDPLAQDELQQQLRQIARKLDAVQRKSSSEPGLPGEKETWLDGQARLRVDAPHVVPPLTPDALEQSGVEQATPRCDPRIAAIGYQARSQVPREVASWLLSLLLLAGVFSLACGVGLLAHAMMTGMEQAGPEGLAWQGGLTITLAGEGMLIVGLTWMAIRLWRNGRRVNHQLRGVDRQLAELQYQAGAKSTNQASSSAAFYDHFARGASSQILLANLRGGLDQLAKRIE